MYTSSDALEGSKHSNKIEGVAAPRLIKCKANGRLAAC